MFCCMGIKQRVALLKAVTYTSRIFSHIKNPFLIGPISASFSGYFRLFNTSQLKFKFKLIKA